MDDGFYKSSEIAIQSGLDKNYYGTLNEEEDKINVRQITYIIDKEATEKGDINEFLHDPAFASKYLNEQVKESLDDPVRWMNEKSAMEFIRFYELDEKIFDQPKILKSLEEIKLKFGGWFHKALAKENQVVEVLAEEGMTWQEKTDKVLQRVIQGEKFIEFYLNEYLPRLLSDGGLYNINEKELEELKAGVLKKIEQYKLLK
ncbi:MAG: hypothetical protein QMD50_00355 [Patescibacteria group bacterium]|nr:hypothetical protein [Patescibacteria group bacterium]